MLTFFLLPAVFALALFDSVFSNDGNEAEESADGAGDDGTPDSGGGGSTDTLPGGGDPQGDHIIRDGTTLDIRNGATGTVFGTRDADQITVDVDHPGYATDGPYVSWTEGDGAPLLSVRGGEGDDTLTLSGSGYVASGGAGRDAVYLDGLHDAQVLGGPGDTIYGQDAADLLPGEAPPQIELTDAATFLGGSARESVVLRGFGGVSDGGAGNDRMLAFDGASTLVGGEGDDWLEGDATDAGYDASETSRITDALGPEGDSLDGGAGNDRLSGGHGDRFTGGSGSDVFDLTFDPDSPGAGALITDFQPGADRVTVHFDGWRDGDSTFTLNGRISTTLSPDGWVEVRGDGQLLLTLQGQSTARIAYALDDTAGPFTALDGTPVPKDGFDILVAPFYERVT